MKLIYLALPSLIFMAAWIGALLLGEAGRVGWNWIDDNERPIERNPVMALVLKTFFREGGDMLDVWLQVVLITLWPLYLAGALVYFVGLHARQRRRLAKQKSRDGVAVQ
ncbi:MULTISPECIES: hypothetical protein [unclassified Pseudomonas]|uniref:hypothetical protein n=1 Tax=unclassified Pseudomonas TaxID=196821 RepID=UPI000A1F29C6|nr:MULTISPECIES: hypothetical protein [unclassified Pseudomonas]